MNWWQRMFAKAAGFDLVAKGSTRDFLTGADVDVPTGVMVQPYRQSLWVQAAIKHIAHPISAVSLQFSSSPMHGGRSIVKKADSLLADPKLEAFWQDPAAGIASFPEFIKATVGWRKLAGEAFWLMDDSALVPFPEAKTTYPRLILARPDRMRHVVHAGLLEGWVFTDAAGRQHNLLPEQVIQLKQWNPYDDWRGLGEYEAARIEAETSLANSRFMRSLADSNGDQGVYVVAKNGLPDDAQKKQIIAQLREKRAMQQRGVFRPVFLTGDISVEDPKVRAVDAAFMESQRLTAEAIFVAFGVPPSMSSKTASYSIGSASDYYRLILDACMPESREVASAIAAASSLMTGKRPLFCWFDWSVHPVMQAVRKESLEALGKLCERGMPMKDAGEYLDLGLPRFAGDQVGYLPIGVVPAIDAQTGPSPGDADEPTDSGTDADPESGKEDQASETDPVKEALRVLRNGAGSDGFKSCRCGKCRPGLRSVCKARDAKEVRAWQAHWRLRQAAAKTYKLAFTRALMEARGEVLRKIEAAASSKSFVTKAGVADLLFDLGKFAGTLKGFMRKAGERTLKQAGQELYAELGKDDPFTYPPAKALQFLRERENRMTDVSQDVFDRVKSVLQDGIDAGNTTDQLASLVRGEFNEMSRSRATTVAMTETAAAYGTARQEGMEQAGVKYKKWLTSGADNVRAAHAEANGQIVPADDAFRVGGEDLMHPGDPHGSAGNVINCHCVAVATEEAPES